MKKIYFLGLSVLICTSLQANQTMKVKMSRTKDANSAAQRSASIQLVTGGMTSGNNYSSGTTMDLNFTLNLTNTDGEYGDSISLTFPAGVVPNSSPNDPIGPDATDPGPDGPEAYNGVFGQVISWGNNDNNWGGIVAGDDYPFTVNVTIDPSFSGPMTVDFFVSGDQFPTVAGDLSGTVTVSQISSDDIAMIAGFVPTGCGLAIDTVICEFTNKGSNAASNFSLIYTSNGGTPVTETYTGTLNPGDTDVYVFTTLLDMTVTGSYNVVFSANLTGDGDATNNDASYTGSNGVNLGSDYLNGFETASDVAGFSISDVDGGGRTWGLNATAPHGGLQCLRVFENKIHGPGITSDDWLFSDCFDLSSTHNYQLTYWKRMTAPFAGAPYGGGIEVSIGQGRTVGDMTQIIKPYADVVGNDTYSKDSVVFQVPADGLFNIGFRALNEDTSKSIAMRLDDIKLKDLGPVGINELNNTIISLYPNPSNGVVNFTTTTASSNIEVYNSIGKKVFSKDELFKGEHTLNLSILPSGLYSIKAYSNNKVETQKVMIKH